MLNLEQAVRVPEGRTTRSSRRRRPCSLTTSLVLVVLLVSTTSSSRHQQYCALAFSVLPTNSRTTLKQQRPSSAEAVRRRTTSMLRSSTMSASSTTTVDTAISTETRDHTQAEDDDEDDLLRAYYQHQAAPIVRRFAVNDDDGFDPPAWLRNNHVQTIAGFLWRENFGGGGGSSYVWRHEPPLKTVRRLLWSSSAGSGAGDDAASPSSSFWHRRERIATPDGDWFHADSRTRSATATTTTDSDTVDGTDVTRARNGRQRRGTGGGGTVIIVHGLESNTDSPAVQQMALAFEQQGFDTVVGLNFRGCSGTPNDTLGGYHLGFTDDLLHYLDLLKKERNGNNDNNDSPIYLAGFSLGANVVLKCLGELGARAVSDYNVQGAAVLCAPLDQRQNAPQLASPGINREIYSKNLMRTMKQRVQYSVDRFCHGDVDTDQFDYRGAMAAQNIMELEDAFLAPVYGFADCWDYYDQTSSIHFLDGIVVPTLILNAEDDPFLDASTWPLEKSVDHGGPVPLKLVRTRFGGHLGYFLHRVDDENDERLLRNAQAPSWAAAELGRFLGHVQQEYDDQTSDNR